MCKKNSDNIIKAIIEIPAFSNPIKYEFDKKNNILMVDRFISTTMQYPANYGFIPKTLSRDKDPMDILVITPFPLQHGVLIHCRPIGILNMNDESGEDIKILSVPISKLTPIYNHIREIEDLPILLIKQIEHFFSHYKDLEDNKWVKIIGWGNSKKSFSSIEDGMKNYSLNFKK